MNAKGASQSTGFWGCGVDPYGTRYHGPLECVEGAEEEATWNGTLCSDCALTVARVVRTMLPAAELGSRNEADWDGNGKQPAFPAAWIRQGRNDDAACDRRPIPILLASDFGTYCRLEEVIR
ncbi:hypothetical protein D9611_013080 [Ephemerocybe angulata]|uniref:Uncharacterized protein n=1 Tax=Ephemerocybe angulata TaxID=980116 RepID=A0A8H5BXP0_9AGAR|nr:hypothetical protein D9611_013080 [Tulosesus angulatus]